MKYYVEQLQKHLDKMFTTLAATLAEVDSPEFEERCKERYGENNHGTLMAVRLGWVHSAAGQVARDTMAPWYIEQILPEVAYAERLVKVCEELGIDESHLTALELLTTNERYRHECSGLREEIAKAVEEVVTDDREREQDEAIAALTAAGFACDDEADIYRRGNFAVTITWDRKRCLYKWLLEDGNNNFRDGESGSFGHLLQHVGIVKQEVAQ
jgi:hypothetical protein